jgi:hypothetical protein
MARWQSHFINSKDNPKDSEATKVDFDRIPEAESRTSDEPTSLGKHRGDIVSQETTVADESVQMTGDDRIPSILPGDVVYIPQLADEQLLYKKGVYLDLSAERKHTVHEWNTKQDVEVHMPALVRKTSVTEEERAEAESLEAHGTLQNRDDLTRPGWYGMNTLLSPQTIHELVLRVDQLERNGGELLGYDGGPSKSIFSMFLQQIRSQDCSQGVTLDTTVRILCSAASSSPRNDNISSYQTREADLERGAALLVGVLIETLEQHLDDSRDALAQLHTEKVQMIARVDEALKEASQQHLKQISEGLHDTSDDSGGDSIEIEPQTMEALKLRVKGVVSGSESLPGFSDDHVKRAFAILSQVLDASPPSERYLLGAILRDFEACAFWEVPKDQTLDGNDTHAFVIMQEALLLSLIISVDAQIQSEHHGIAPRIRNRLTTLLMDKRANLLSSVAELQGGTTHRSSSPDSDSAADRPRSESPSTYIEAAEVRQDPLQLNIITPTPPHSRTISAHSDRSAPADETPNEHHHLSALMLTAATPPGSPSLEGKSTHVVPSTSVVCRSCHHLVRILLKPTEPWTQSCPECGSTSIEQPDVLPADIVDLKEVKPS